MAKGPTYYQRGTIDVWHVIRDQALNVPLGNAIKYICRAGYKDSKIQDLEKAIHYLQNELDHEKHLYFRASQGISYKVRDKELTLQTNDISSKGFDH